jgi:hypothetical protein
MADKKVVEKRKTAYPVKERVETKEECGCVLVTFRLEDPNNGPERIETYRDTKGHDCPHTEHQKGQIVYLDGPGPRGAPAFKGK